ncbi:hypothetical protein [Nocardiopsis alborubida]|uniref:Uncharacterized protein n=1 Tax=Nocardiopsis alborubida TaxID=146802 RepID=A0A7X6M8X9_9ACTN|nr:hypothetical protein [Nocardiopsis alborubida]NKY96560.1 hypothetical protein [Nocardiopsis alborubida]
MANNTVRADQLTEGSVVTIRGKLAFARLTRRIEGKELAQANVRRRQAGMKYDITSPYTTATISGGAQVIYADPDNPTLEEQYVAERCYTSKKKPEDGLSYSIDSKGNNLPSIGIPGEGGFVQDLSGQELARGLDVTLVLEVYKARDQENRGLGLTHVLVNEAPRYYTPGSVDESQLKARGITLAQPMQAVPSNEATPVGGAEPVGTEVDKTSGLSFPAPQPAGQVQQAPTQPAPSAQQVVPAPVAQPQAVQQAQPSSVQAEETAEQKLARIEAENARLRAENQAAKDVASAIGTPDPSSPWAPQQSQPQAGIAYNG